MCRKRYQPKYEENFGCFRDLIDQNSCLNWNKERILDYLQTMTNVSKRETMEGYILMDMPFSGRVFDDNDWHYMFINIDLLGHVHYSGSHQDGRDFDYDLTLNHLKWRGDTYGV